MDKALFGDSDSSDENGQVEAESLFQQGYVVQVVSVGGGRGVFASRDLSPGELVLLEEPCVQWPAR